MLPAVKLREMAPKVGNIEKTETFSETFSRENFNQY